MEGVLTGIDRIIVETDESNPVIIVKLTEDWIKITNEGRLRVRPVYAIKEGGGEDGRSINRHQDHS